MPSLLRSARSTGVIAGITLAVLIATGLMLALTHSKSAARQQRLVVANYETMGLMREMVIAVQDAEIGMRGFLLTGDISSLEPYERARLRIETNMRLLEAMVAGDPDTTRQFQEFRSVTAQKFEQLNATVGVHQLNGREAALALDRTGAGRAMLGQIRLLGDALVEGQRLLLARRVTALRSEQEQADIAGLLVMAGAFVCLIVGIYIVVRSASRLERSQLELAGRSRLLQATLESLRDPIFVVDDRRTVVAWNEAFAKLAQWEPGKQAPPTLDQLLSDRSPATRALLLPLDLGAMSPKGSAVVRVAHDGRDYEIYRGEMSGGGAVVRCIDITEKLHDEAALRQGQKMEATGQLTGGMAHDFNNILQVIRANLDLLKGEVGDNAAMASRVQSATAAADRGARLTQQLLAFARRQPLTPQPTNVARLVGDLADLMRHSLGERIAIELKVTDDPWNAKVDAGQLENAILNLSINARDAMPDGGTVRVEVSNATLDRRYAALHPDVTPGPYVLVDVGDTGTGMPPEVVAQAFDPFFTTKGDGRGTGLGLSMVYGFVRQSNGHIRIDSAIGQGTSVKLYLPRTEDPVPEERSDPGSSVSGTERILVVEDSEDVRRAVVDMLTGWGYRVEAAEDPDVALAFLEKDPAFDLLFTDIVMPGTITAVELAQHAQRLRPGIAVLLTSGFARGLIPDHTRSGYPMIAKPYGSDALSAKLRSVLSNRRPTPAVSPAKASPDRVEQPMEHSRSRRVLFVEDEVVLRMSTTDMLERLGCSVAGVGSGEAALDLLGQEQEFDLLLTDVGLPGMSGEELAAKVREKYPSLPVVIASGYGRSGTQADRMHFISKPYSSIDLQQALDHAVRNVS
ncbi:response regulator [Reyranella sp. MMS21-HV4-11]|uniref:histidine kinase n=1 Tax=Reyranella humidisoli TaxID=2849149 RepID=A0ABS6ILD1_9HYPH|nr:response regulator [Reyranella sp. MMS21-HV4-11]MBU8875401.1 response regulator [Reyranella sp. MMS21-HV4-11]